MHFKLPKFLSDVIDSFTIEKVLLWLKEMIKFYILPKAFFKNLYQRSFRDQVEGLVFYTVFQVIVAWLLFSESYGEIPFRMILLIIIICVPFSIANLLSVLFISKSKFNIGRIISCIYLIWLLLWTPSLFFFKLFLATENYLFYAMYNVINAIAFLYSLFLIWHIFFTSALKIILGYILNIAILNLSFLLFAFILFDPYSKIEASDPIVEELNESLNELKTLSGTPSTFIEETNLNTYASNRIITLLRNDSIAYQNINDIKVYKDMIEHNNELLDSIIPKINFRRNREILSEVRTYNKNLEKIFDDPACDTCLTKDIVYYDQGDTSIMRERKEFLIDQAYIQPYKDFHKKIDEISALYNIANYPGQFTAFLLEPAILIAKLIGLRKNGNITLSF